VAARFADQVVAALRSIIAATRESALRHADTPVQFRQRDFTTCKLKIFK
jgi:hypothetical protein